MLAYLDDQFEIGFITSNGTANYEWHYYAYQLERINGLLYWHQAIFYIRRDADLSGLIKLPKSIRERNIIETSFNREAIPFYEEDLNESLPDGAHLRL